MWKIPNNKRLLEADDSDHEQNNDSHLTNKRTKITDRDLEQEILNEKVYSMDNHIWFNTNVTKKSIIKLKIEIDRVNNNIKNIINNNRLVNIIPKPIYLHLHSFGGCVFSAFLAIDFIKNSYVDIHTIIEGPCASAATLISVTAKKRYMTRNSSMLIHQLSDMIYGKKSEIDDDIQNVNEMMDKIYDIYTKNCNRKKNISKRNAKKFTKKKLIEILKHDRWWDYNKCLQFGLVDELWTNKIDA